MINAYICHLCCKSVHDSIFKNSKKNRTRDNGKNTTKKKIIVLNYELTLTG